MPRFVIKAVEYANYYRPPMKLRQGNVFIHVCPSVNPHESPHVTITCDALDPIIQDLAPLDIRPGTSPPTPC